MTLHIRPTTLELTVLAAGLVRFGNRTVQPSGSRGLASDIAHCDAAAAHGAGLRVVLAAGRTRVDAEEIEFCLLMVERHDVAAETGSAREARAMVHWRYQAVVRARHGPREAAVTDAPAHHRLTNGGASQSGDHDRSAR